MKVSLKFQQKQSNINMKRFYLKRHEDESGISGTGIVAEGIQFSTGKCALAWVSEYFSIAIYDSIEELNAIHGHNGKTQIIWLDASL